MLPEVLQLLLEESVHVRDDHVEDVGDQETYGVGVRVLVPAEELALATSAGQVAGLERRRWIRSHNDRPGNRTRGSYSRCLWSW